MKNTIIKKALACMTSLMAVSALSVSMASYAVDTPTINNPPANKLETAQREVGIPVNKDIVLFNVDESQILSPNIIYSYEVTPANIPTENPAKITTYAPEDLDTDGKTPKEGAVPITVTVKSGVLAAISTVGDNTETTNKREATISFGAANDNKGNDNVTKHATNKESAETIDLTKKVRNSMTITVDANKIYDPDYGKEEHTNTQVNGPGVYRYKIEDVTTPETLAASGIDRKYKDTTNDHDKYVYLDVYTKYNANKDGLVIYGYVLLKDAQGNDNVDVTYDHTETGETLKVTGFDTESENTNTYSDQNFNKADLTSDAYHTYNVEVSKKTEGDLADTQHNFPFKIELTNSNKVTSLDDFYFVITKDGQAINARTTSLGTGKLADTEFGVALDANGTWILDGSPSTSDSSAASANLKLQNGDKIVITGLPVKTSIKVTETNDTADTYSVSATNLVQPTGGDTTAAINFKGKTANNEDIDVTSLSVAKNNTAEMSAALEITKTDKGQKIVFTNTLKDISVTGLLFNIAPFIFITAAGVVLITLFMRNKKKDNSDNMI
ncbi:MAG: hypothetical protein J6I55_01485 [Ruminococcus sp.]|nr:hypothetical protein [Ruminococcus sp.]